MRIIKIFTICVIVFIVCVLFATLMNRIKENRENCYPYTYLEYPCEGATFYARSHRNSNKPCRKTKYICNS